MKLNKSTKLTLLWDLRVQLYRIIYELQNIFRQFRFTSQNLIQVRTCLQKNAKKYPFNSHIMRKFTTTCFCVSKSGSSIKIWWTVSKTRDKISYIIAEGDYPLRVNDLGKLTLAIVTSLGVSIFLAYCSYAYMYSVQIASTVITIAWFFFFFLKEM